MKTITVPAKEQVSTTSQAIFEQLQKKLGRVPNLYATIGYSSNALKGMLDHEAALAAVDTFSAKEREAINLIVSQVNACDYCLAAHTVLAQMRGFTKEETLQIRKGNATDPKLDAAIKLAASVAQNKGNADAQLLEAFFAAGYDEAALMDLLGSIALRTFTNYVYALTKVPVDFPAADPIN
jgi:uncharacterized peroxidase-related enzyme